MDVGAQVDGDDIDDPPIHIDDSPIHRDPYLPGLAVVNKKHKESTGV